MENYICVTCGVEFTASITPPESCVVCMDERQYVGWDGQQWTTMEDMQSEGYVNEVKDIEPNLTGIGITPSFSIGQRALLVQTDYGNVLYDCVSLLDDNAMQEIRNRGGIQVICCSHPHFYDAMVTYSHTFDNATIYIPEADKEFVMRPDPVINYWDGNPLPIFPGTTLVQTGGHFPGSAVLHWAAGADGKGALLSGDTFQVVSDRRYLSWMISYPNIIPMSAAEVRSVIDSVKNYEYDRIYGGWWRRDVMSDAKGAVRRSADRYIKRIEGRD